METHDSRAFLLFLRYSKIKEVQIYSWVSFARKEKYENKCGDVRGANFSFINKETE